MIIYCLLLATLHENDNKHREDSRWMPNNMETSFIKSLDTDNSQYININRWYSLSLQLKSGQKISSETVKKKELRFH